MCCLISTKGKKDWCWLPKSKPWVGAGFREWPKLQAYLVGPFIKSLNRSNRLLMSPGGFASLLAGRKGIQVHHPDLLKDLESLVDPVTRRDPMSPLRWTCKSTRQLSGELVLQGYPVSNMTVAELLHRLDYSLQANAKTLEGAHHADRNEQFNYINTRVKEFLQRGQPVISVDTKKKNRWGSSRMGVENGSAKGNPKKWRFMILRPPSRRR